MSITLDELRAMMGMGGPLPATYSELLDRLLVEENEFHEKLSRSRGQSKRLCIQGAITVNGTVERDFHRLVSSRDDVQKLTKSVGEGE